MNYEFEDNYDIFAGVSDKVIERINEIRKERKVSMRQIADHIGVSLSTVNRYLGENHSNGMTLVFLVGVADTLGVDVTEFFTNRKSVATLKDAVRPFKKRIAINPEKELAFFLQYLADSFQ